jgi:hypothetical protein
MGKMIDVQSIVVASTATRWYGHEGSILVPLHLDRSPLSDPLESATSTQQMTQ